MPRLTIKTLFVSLSILSLMLLIVISVGLYRYITDTTTERLEHVSHEKANDIRYEMIRFYDEMVYQFERTTQQQYEKMAIAQRYFEKNGIDAPLEPLQKLLEDETSSFDIYLINHDLVVERTTYPPDLGLDFNAYPDLPALFREQFADPSRIDVGTTPLYEASGVNYKRYTTQRSRDGKYLIELGQSLKDEHSLRQFMLDLKKTIPTLKSHIVYKVYSHDDGVTSVEETWSTRLIGMGKNDIVKTWEGIGNIKEVLMHLDPASEPFFNSAETLYPYLERVFRGNLYLESDYWENDRYIHLILLPFKSYYHQTETSFAVLVLYFDETQAYEAERSLYLSFGSVWGMIIIVTFAMAFVFYRRIISPLSKLQSKIHKKQPVNDPSLLSGSDEISQMARTYNWLLEDLQNEIRANADLLEKFKTFTANAIHQIRTPLSVIKIALASMNDSDNEAKLHIRSSLVSMEHLYDTLAFSLQNETTELPVQEVEFDEVLRERIDLFSPVAASLDTTIQAEIAKIGSIRMNRTELEFLIDNNLSNALKYGKPHRPVTVTLRTTPTEHILTFESYGEPIKGNKRLFERYARFDQSKKGFGIGLNIVADICRRYDIVIQVAYEKEKNCFRYFIPSSRRM